jgi:hypothetical protein
MSPFSLIIDGSPSHPYCTNRDIALLPQLKRLRWHIRNKHDLLAILRFLPGSLISLELNVWSERLSLPRSTHPVGMHPNQITGCPCRPSDIRRLFVRSWAFNGKIRAPTLAIPPPNAKVNDQLESIRGRCWAASAVAIS